MHHSRSHISSRPRPLLPRLLGARKSFTPEEVRKRLQIDHATDERTAAVHATAALASMWSSSVPDRLAFDLGRTANRLPTVVFWFRQGVSAHEIGQRLSPFGGAWDANRAIDAAASLIADVLNSQQAAHA